MSWCLLKTSELILLLKSPTLCILHEKNPLVVLLPDRLKYVELKMWAHFGWSLVIWMFSINVSNLASCLFRASGYICRHFNPSQKQRKVITACTVFLRNEKDWRKTKIMQLNHKPLKWQLFSLSPISRRWCLLCFDFQCSNFSHSNSKNKSF